MGSPLYEGLAATLRELVISGRLLPGQRLPSEADLVAEHGVSRNTVRQALTLLEREGLLVSAQGRGWSVRERDPVRWRLSRPERGERTDISPADAWSEDVREQGRVPTERLQAIILQPEPRIARLLELDADAEVWVRRRLRFVDGELFAQADTYFPEQLVRDTEIARPRDVLPGTLAVLERLGYPVRRHRNEVISRNATAVEADLFGVQPGDAMVEVARTRWTEDGRPVAVTITVAPGDRVIIVMEGEQ